VPVIRFAEAQTEGKGRSGRQWITPYASQLACSILYPFDALPHGLSGLSLVVGLAAVDALAHSGIEGVMLKWPNDLFFEHQKLGGILIEVQGDPTSSCRCVISLGINCYAGSSSHVTARIDQPWIDCESLSGKVFSRNQLAGRLLSSLFSKIGRFAKQGLAPFLNEWRQHDMLLGQKVVMQVGDRRLEGVGKGVAVNGAFLLQTAEDTIELHSGEARLVKSIGNG
jgi:BirA family biotin operon repressor/biotin-[acetyl-CoA-carboxylase] ligase